MKAVSSVEELRFEGRRVKLRSILEKDFSTLLNWRNDVSDLMLWSSARAVIPESAYVEELQSDYKQGLCRLGVEDKRTGELVGHVFAYGYSEQNAHAYFGIYICRDNRESRIGFEATALFIKYMFAYFSLTKVYFDVFEYNLRSAILLEKAGLHKEGDFKKHIQYNGRAWSMYRYALYREDLGRVKRYLDWFTRLKS